MQILACLHSLKIFIAWYLRIIAWRYFTLSMTCLKYVDAFNVLNLVWIKVADIILHWCRRSFSWYVAKQRLATDWHTIAAMVKNDH